MPIFVIVCITKKRQYGIRIVKLIGKELEGSKTLKNNRLRRFYGFDEEK